MSKATERPWRMVDKNDKFGHANVVTIKGSNDSGCSIVAFCWKDSVEQEAEANAQLIVQAVNSFNPQYVEALENVLKRFITVIDATQDANGDWIDLNGDYVAELNNPALRNHK